VNRGEVNSLNYLVKYNDFSTEITSKTDSSLFLSKLKQLVVDFSEVIPDSCNTCKIYWIVTIKFTRNVCGFNHAFCL